MIKGDEGKPMSILEFISDEPCEPEPFIDALITDYRGRLAVWATQANKREDAAFWLERFISDLDDIKRKMHRPR